MIVEFTGFLVEEDRRRDVRIRISGPHHDIAGDDSYFEVAAPEIFDRVERIFGVDEAQARKLAEAYLDFLFKPKAQALIAKFSYRPAFPQYASKEDLKRFAKIELVTIDKQFGGWPAAQKKFFADGGIFDEIQKR